MTAADFILVALALPLLGGVGIVLAGKQPNLREGVTLTTAALLFYCVLQLLDPVLAG